MKTQVLYSLFFILEEICAVQMTGEIFTMASGRNGLISLSNFWKNLEGKERCTGKLWYHTECNKIHPRFMILPEMDEDSQSTVVDNSPQDLCDKACHSDSISNELRLDIQQCCSSQECDTYVGFPTQIQEACRLSAPLRGKSIFSARRTLKDGGSCNFIDTESIIDNARCFLEECDMPEGIQIFCDIDSVYGHTIASILPTFSDDFGPLCYFAQGSLHPSNTIPLSRHSYDDHCNQIVSLVKFIDNVNVFAPHNLCTLSDTVEPDANRAAYMGVSQLLITNGVFTERSTLSFWDLRNHLTISPSRNLVSTFIGLHTKQEHVYHPIADIFQYSSLYPFCEAENTYTSEGTVHISRRGSLSIEGSLATKLSTEKNALVRSLSISEARVHEISDILCEQISAPLHTAIGYTENSRCIGTEFLKPLLKKPSLKVREGDELHEFIERGMSICDDYESMYV